METSVTIRSTPKLRFQMIASNIKQHRDMLAQPCFERGTDAAFNQYADQLGRANSDMNIAAAMGLKLCGAMEYLKVLKDLSEEIKIVERKDLDNLQHKI